MKGILKTQIAVLLASVIVVGVSAEELSDNLGFVEPLPEFDCLIEPGEMVDIGSPVPGVIERVYADLGDFVEMGGALTKLDSKVEQAALELARTRASSTAEIELQHENAEFSKRLHSRNQELFQKSVISSHDMDRFETEQRVALLQKRQAENNNRIAQLEFQRALELLKQRTILSPINGVVTERYKSVGEYVDDEPLLRLAQLDPLHVEIIVPAEYWGRLSPGRQAEVTPQILGQEKKIATVDRIDPVIDSASGTFRVQLQLSNPEHLITAGLKCRLVFLPEKKDTALNHKTPNITMTEAVADEPIVNESLAEVLSPRLQSASMLKQQRQQAEAGPMLEITPGSCFSVGPVTEEKIARQLAEQLASRSLTLTMLQGSQSVLKGYQVHSKPLPTMAKVHALVSRLKSEKVRDFLVTSDRETGQHWVSLGLYQNRQNAVNRVKVLTGKGFQVELRPRYQEDWTLGLNLTPDHDKAAQSELERIVSHIAPQEEIKSVGCHQLLAQNR